MINSREILKIKHSLVTGILNDSNHAFYMWLFFLIPILFPAPPPLSISRFKMILDQMQVIQSSWYRILFCFFFFFLLEVTVDVVFMYCYFKNVALQSLLFQGYNLVLGNVHVMKTSKAEVNLRSTDISQLKLASDKLCCFCSYLLQKKYRLKKCSIPTCNLEFFVKDCKNNDNSDCSTLKQYIF